jgi:hypothetical protein
MTDYTRYLGVAALTLGLTLAGARPGLAAVQERSDKDDDGMRQPLADGVQFGATYGEWSARWWQWLLGIPADRNPNLDSTGAFCGEGQTGRVWFLAGTFGGEPVTRTCTVPSGKGIFFPVVNTVTFAPIPTEGIAALRGQAAGFVDGTTQLRVTLDGTALRGLRDLRVQSPAFSMVVPVGGLLGAGACEPLFVPLTDPPLPPEPQGLLCNPAVADGFWVLLSPLRSGEHTLRFRAEVGDFRVDVTYKLNVLP